MKTKFLVWALTLCMLLMLVPTTVFAENGTVTIAGDDDWTDFCANAAENADKTVEVTADFCTNGTQFAERFTGTVNGNGHTVTFGTAAKAMFADFAGIASDLTLGTNANNSMLNGAGGKVGAFANEISGDAILQGLDNQLCVVVTSSGAIAGGLVGFISGTGAEVRLIGCSNHASMVQGTNAKNRGVAAKNGGAAAGGLVGAVTGTDVSLTFIRCTNDGYVHSVDGGCYSVGGFLARWNPANGSLTFDRCVNNSMYSYAKGNIGVKGHIGGFLGRGPAELTDNTFALTFLKCANRADIQATPLLGNSKYPSDLAGFVSHTAADRITFAGCSNSGDLSYVNPSNPPKLDKDYNMEIAGFAAGCQANVMTFTSCCNSGTLDAATVSTAAEGAQFDGHTLRCSADGLAGSFTRAATGNFDADDILDLTVSGSLSDAAALGYGTVFNADGTFCWETATVGSLATASGARIRTNVPTGLRFDTSISKADYDALRTTCKSVTFGTLIAPLAYVREAGNFTAAALDQLGHPINYLDVAWTANELTASEDGQTLTFNGSVVEIAEENYQLRYAARGYVLCVTADDEEVLIWADYSELFFDRTVYQVAKSALADPDNGLSDAALTVVSGIVSAVENS